MGFNRRYDPGHNNLKKELIKGKIGKLEKVIITSRDPAPPSIKYLKESGGIFKDMMIHDFDLARYYLEKEKWIAAMNRFKNVVENYDKTIYIEEALHRLVEIYFILGLKEESKKYANLLGYNYLSSEWYEKSYSMFNKMYNKKKKERIKKEKS